MVIVFSMQSFSFTDSFVWTHVNGTWWAPSLLLGLRWLPAHSWSSVGLWKGHYDLMAQWKGDNAKSHHGSQMGDKAV